MKLIEKQKLTILKEKFDFVSKHFSSEWYNLILQILKQVYATDKLLLRNKQFAQCTLQNRILINLLVQTGKFKQEDIEKRWKPFWGIHQYLIVSIDKKRFLVDPFYERLEEY